MSHSAKFKLKLINYAKEYENKAVERRFAPPPTECMIRQWRKQEQLIDAKKEEENQQTGQPCNRGSRLGLWSSARVGYVCQPSLFNGRQIVL